jgi:hypothetical protein
MFGGFTCTLSKNESKTIHHFESPRDGKVESNSDVRFMALRILNKQFQINESYPDFGFRV